MNRSVVIAVMGMKYVNDVAVRLAVFYLKVVGFWFATTRLQLWFRCLTVIYTIVMSVFAMWIQSMGIYYCWGDFTMCTYIFVHILGIAISLLKLCLLLLQKKKFLRLIEFMRRNFWHSNYSPKEIQIFAGAKRICIYFVCSFSFISQFTVFLYSIRPVLLNIGKNESERVLLFRMWLDLPLSTTPYFEIMYVLQVLSLYQCDVGYICFDNIFCIMCLHAAGQFRILQYRLRNIHQLATKHEDNLSTSTSHFSYKCFVVLKECIQQHEMIIAFCKLFEEVFKVIVLCQVIMFSMLVCLVGYQIFLVDLNLPMRVSLTSFIISNMCQLWVFTYSCDTMTRESLSVATGMYAAPWADLSTDKFGKMIRKDLQIVIMRSRRGCHITACGFFSVSLETYTRILSTAMSYFTLLKGSTVDVDA